jgi:hypothetical protein
MRNGPCGGTFAGRCEVVDKPCIWVEIYEHAKSAERLDDLRAYIPPRNPLLQGTSSWINYFLNRDNRPEHTTSLYQPPSTLPTGALEKAKSSSISVKHHAATRKDLSNSS